MEHQTLSRKIMEAKIMLRKYLNNKGYECGIFWFGAIDIHPKHLAVWITVKTDKEKKELLNDPELINRFRQFFIDVHYPTDAIKDIGMAVESQENVDRTFDGNWWYAIK